MDEEQKSALQNVKNNPKILWGAIILGVITLAAGIFFYANSNGGLLPGGGEEPKSMEAALEEATARFIALRGRLESEEVSQEIIEEVVDIREDLERAVPKEADEAVLEMWRQLDEDLRAVEQILRDTLERSSGP